MNKPKPKLHYCSHCKEYSCTRKVHVNKSGESYRIEVCINKGCGYKLVY